MRVNEKVLVMENTGTSKHNVGNSKWDMCLDDYNNYVKEYNRHYLKAQKGDLRSLSLYPYMKQKWESVKKRLVKAYNKERLSEQQVKRIAKINTKVVSAVLN